MSEYGTTRAPQPVSGWAIGGVIFAGVTMVIIGAFHIVEGLAAIINDDFFVVRANYSFDLDTTGWGWIHLILGIIVALAGVSIFSGRLWARIIGITLASLSALANFFFIPYYPFWSLLVIALDIWVIWALTRPVAVEA